jgi:hypothetical protein
MLLLLLLGITVTKRCASLAHPATKMWWLQLRLVCQPYNSVVIRILPPYVPSEREMAQPHVFAENVRRLFSQELRLPMVEQVFTYARLGSTACIKREDGLPGAVCSVPLITSR